MATTYYSDLCRQGGGIQTKYGVNGVITVMGTFALTAALVVNDVIKMVPVPKGAVILGGWLSATDLDTGGSPAIVLDVGDTDSTDDTDRYVDGSTAGQTGAATVAQFDQRAGLGYQFAEAGTIDVLVQVAPATGATSGTIKLLVSYTLDAT